MKRGIRIVKYVALGDSITAYRSHVKTYYEHISEQMDEWLRGETINSGVGGWNTNDLFHHLEEKCLQYKPQIVSIMIGTNDHAIYKSKAEPAVVLERYEQNLRAIIDALYQASLHKPKLILMTPPFVATQTSPAGTQTSQERIEQYARVVKDISSQLAISFIDCNAIIGQAVAYTDDVFVNEYTDRFDGVHLNSKAQELIAPYIISAMKQCLRTG